MREREIEKYLADQVKRHGGRSYKWSSPSHRGVPDRLVLFPNVILAVEVKALGKKRVIFRVPFGMAYAMARLFEVVRLPFLRKSQVDNLRIDKEYSVSQTERRFNLTFSNPREEINRIVK